MTINAQNCRNFEPSMFVVNHASGEKLSPVFAELLTPVNIAALHYWELSEKDATELHYYDYDEYWACYEWTGVAEKGARTGHLYRKI